MNELKGLPVIIDGETYDFESLTGVAKNLLTSIQVVKQNIANIQQQLSIMQTARSAYVAALKEECEGKH